MRHFFRAGPGSCVVSHAEAIADGDAGRKRWLLGAEEGGNWVVAAKQPAANRGKKRPVAAV
jgi:hypothetical protein